MCEGTSECTNGDDCELIVRHEHTQMESVEYYCKAHLIDRVWEVEHDQHLDIVDVKKLW